MSFKLLAPNQEDSNIDSFNQMMQDVDTGNAAQAELAKQALEAIILGPPTTIPPIPTRTADPNAEVIETTAQDVATSASTTAVTKPEGDQCIEEADAQLSKQSALETMLVRRVRIGRWRRREGLCLCPLIIGFRIAIGFATHESVFVPFYILSVVTLCYIMVWICSI